MGRLHLVVALLAACGGSGQQAVDAAESGDTGGSAGGAVLLVRPTTVSFGGVITGMQSVAAAVTITNAGDATSGTLTAMLGGSNATQFTLIDTTCSGTLAPAATCVANVRFSPTQAAPATAALDVSDGSASATAVLNGTGLNPGDIFLTPTLHDFGMLGVGATSAFTFTVHGAGIATGTITVTVGGTNAADFTRTGSCHGTSLAPNATCTVTIAFSPGATGARAGEFTVTATPGGSLTGTLIGTGVAPASSLVVTPTPWDFGSVRIGDSSFGKMFTISHPAGATTGPLALSMTGTHPGDFIKMADNCNGQTLGAGGSCTVFVSFEPGAVGPRNGRLSVTASPGGTAEAELSGTCTAQ